MRTPTESVLAAGARDRGAALVETDGWLVAAHFGDPAAEYRTLREGAGIVDLAAHARLRVTGGDRIAFLQGMLSNDVKVLEPGGGCHTLLLSDQGKVVADLVALAAPDAVLLDGIEEGVRAAAEALARYIVADDVELAPVGAATHVVGVYGPGAGRALERLGTVPPRDPYAHELVALLGASVRVVAVPSPGAGGVLCDLASAEAPGWWSRCLATGAVTPVGHEAFETWRIESGVPAYGRDVSPATLALEAPLESAISFAKGCYLGQEVVERVTARGHVNRRLVGLVIDGATVPAAADRIRADAREIGWVTSAAWSWARDRPVALGYVRREYLDPGTAVEVGSASGPQPATVASLPLV